MPTPRVLVVEDSYDLRTELVDHLRHVGLDTHGVATARELFSHMAASSWDIVLLDLSLPDGDGLVAAHRLRRDYPQSLGLIIITARGQASDRIAGAEVGADAYLVKPLNILELRAVIDNLVRRIRALQAPETRPPHWVLSSGTLELTAPNGVTTVLTGSETLVLKQLLSSPSKTMSREALCSVLVPTGENREDTRRLDSLISRMRSKVQRDSETPLPIRSLRNMGYIFTDECDVL